MTDSPAPGFGRRLIKYLWRRALGRNITANDNTKQIDRLYTMPDPWNLASSREQFRFEQTVSLLEARVGHVGSLLEVGCGEGHQSLHLSRLCDRLYGFDVSPKAIIRAQSRLPGANFAPGDIHNIPWKVEGGFDLVVACEVLYYMRDIPAAIARMNTLGSACLVTFFGPAAAQVAPHLDTLKDVERGWFFHPPYAWLYAFWHNKPQS